MKKPLPGETQRAKLVKELELVKHYQRTHTPTGVNRRLPDPPEPEVTASQKKLKNLKPRKEKPP